MEKAHWKTPAPLIILSCAPPVGCRRPLAGRIRGSRRQQESDNRAAVTIAMEADHTDPDLHRILAEQISRIGQLKDVEASNCEVHALVRAYLESRRKEMRKIDPSLATFVSVSAIEAVAHNTVLNGAEMPTEKMVKVLVDETTRLVVGYLR